MQIAKHGDCRDQQRNKIGFRRLPLVSSRAGQAIEGTRSARAGQSQQFQIKAIPGSRVHSVRRPKSGGDASGVSTPSALCTSVPILSATPAPLVQFDRNTRTI